MAVQYSWKQQRAEHWKCPRESIMHFRDFLLNLYLKCYNRNITGTLVTLYRTLLILMLIVYPGSAQQTGCRLIGLSRRVQIRGCPEFHVHLNACVGYCESFAYPSPNATLDINRRHMITSRAECCSIVDTEDKRYEVLCDYGEQLKIFKSATACSCSVCRS